MANPPGNPHQNARGDRTGRYVPTLETAERDAYIADQLAAGRSQRDVAIELGLHHKTVADAQRRAIRAILKEPGEKLLALHMARLESAYAQLMELAEGDYITVSHGKVITDDDGNPLPDIAPKIAAFREGRATLESFRKLIGLDAPSRVSIDAQQLGDEILTLLDTAAGPADGDSGA